MPKQHYSVFINYDEDTCTITEFASSPKEAALRACFHLVRRLGKNITRSKLEQGLEKRDYNGESLVNWWGIFIEVTSESGKKYHYAQVNYL